MAARCRVIVITRKNNQKVIERALRETDANKPEFLYYDLPKSFLLLKRWLGAVGIYYFLWQIAIRWHFRKILPKVDVIHHVTFNGVQMPGFWVATDTPVVLGPLGGGMCCPGNLLPLMGDKKFNELLRSFLVRNLSLLPWWNVSLSNASAILAANRETAELIQARTGRIVPVMLETAVDGRSIVDGRKYSRGQGPLRLLWLGSLISRKAPVIAVLAMAGARARGADVSLIIAGAGDEEERLRNLVAEKHLQDHVSFAGRIPKSEVNDLMDNADAFIFTSLRDTSGNVVLEAMARGLPVIALRHQGAAKICAPDSALLVEPTDIEGTISSFADAINRLWMETDLAVQLANSARNRLSTTFTWDQYANQMSSVYQSVTDYPSA
jgi:glycosyltransferase involved in cell wall biosynthesis